MRKRTRRNTNQILQNQRQVANATKNSIGKKLLTPQMGVKLDNNYR